MILIEASQSHRSFVEAFNSTLRVHDTLAQNRLRFAQRLIEMSEELTNLAKEGERLRKLVRRGLSVYACGLHGLFGHGFSTRRLALGTRRMFRKQNFSWRRPSNVSTTRQRSWREYW